MAVMICFCIAGYIEQSSGIEISKKELENFIENNYEVVEEWLMGESKTMEDE